MQEISERVRRKLVYEATAVVRIHGNDVISANVSATLRVETIDKREYYLRVGSVQAKESDWAELRGKFLLNGSPSKVFIYLEGPPVGTDILFKSFAVKLAKATLPSPPPLIENASYGVNIIENSDQWFCHGNCTLSVHNGSPKILPPMAKESLGSHEPLSGRYLIVTDRTQTWMGPAQIITDQLKLFLTYQVSAWVKIGSGASGPQNVQVGLTVDDEFVKGGQVEATSDRWREVVGSFRIEKVASKVMVSIQGPSSGVDLMVAGFQIFAVDRQARFAHLRNEADKIRKSDVVLKFATSPGSFVNIKQVTNSFPLGTCIDRTSIDNEEFVDFFMNNFNWAVFGDELKWNLIEPEGNLHFKDADEMLALCQENNIQVRGHFDLQVECNAESWVSSLSTEDLMSGVHYRLKDILTRYKGKFKHYDLNNETLDRLGDESGSNIFKTAQEHDPDTLLFVNDKMQSPEKYIEHILHLQMQGSPIGGIGVQGHVESPVGPIVCSELDKLGALGLPIWFTSLDVSSVNEHVRADDLEVMLREAFAHSAVEGVILWSFWEMFKGRENSHLVNAEGDVNEAGKRLIELKREWTTNVSGHVDELGEFKFRGFHGSYEMEVATQEEIVKKMFVVEKGDSPLVVNIDISK